MTSRRSAVSIWLAWGLCALIALGSAANLAWVLLNTQGKDAFTLANSLISASLPLAFAVPGALIVVRRSGNVIGWLLIGPALLGLVPSDGYMSQFTTAPAHAGFLLLLNLWLQTWGWLLLIMPILFIPLLFPTGRLLSPRWRWVVGAGLGMSVFFIFIATFGSQFNWQNAWSVPNPIGFIPLDSFLFGIFEVAWGPSLAGLVVLCVASLFLRYRRAGTLERQQIKWLLYGCTLFALVYVPSALGSGTFWGSLGSLLLSLSILIIPIAITLAVLRYRLYDIDLIIRKTLVYGALTALLGLGYAGSVILLQQIIEAISGQRSPLAIVLSTLAIAALFSPLRRRVQAIVDRRFYRRQVNAAAALAAFAAAARDETDLDALTAELARVVRETMQPAGVSLWLPARKA